ncbi:hypothetical protein evm_010967 [Chilo suppressalis]|nr:hypothetical protein evm_010967 [Chilo suppressalis]
MGGIWTLGHDPPCGPSADCYALTTACTANFRSTEELVIVHFWSPIQGPTTAKVCIVRIMITPGKAPIKKNFVKMIVQGCQVTFTSPPAIVSSTPAPQVYQHEERNFVKRHYDHSYALPYEKKTKVLTERFLKQLSHLWIKISFYLLHL